MDEYDGRQYVGIDLHRRRSVIVRMTPESERVGSTVRIDNDPFELAQQVASWGESPEVMLEATYGWYWTADVLAEAGASVHLAHPLGVKGFAYRRVKNDLLTDAADLADLLRMGRLPEAWVAPAQVRGLREEVRHRRFAFCIVRPTFGHSHNKIRISSCAVTVAGDPLPIRLARSQEA